MKFKRDQLLPAIASACRAIEKKPIQPIRGNVLIRESGGGAEVIGTDLRTTVCTEVETDGAGSFCVAGHNLLGIVGKLDSEDVEIKTVKDKVVVSGGAAKFEMDSDKPRDFPEVPSFDGAWQETDAKAFSGLLSRTSYAALSHDTRVHLTAVILSSKDGVVEACSTDGHRLALNRASMPWPKAEPCLVPSAVAPTIAKLIGDADKCDIRIATSAATRLIQVRAGKSAISCKLVDADPVPYAKFVGPDAFVDAPVRLDRESLRAAVGRALSFKGEIAKADGTEIFDVGGDLIVGGTGLTIARQTLRNRFDERLEAIGHAGPEKRVRLNLRYLADALEHIDAGAVDLHIRGELDPVALVDAKKDQIAVIMPTRP